jgi:2'-5' RNA ligase
MRLFFAVTIPQDLIEKTLDAQNALRELVGDEGVRWTKPEQFHFTLKFLGEVSTELAESAVAAANVVRERHRPFTIEFGGLGAFPSDQRPSTLWTGAAEGSDSLTALAGDLDQQLANAKFKRETRPLKAHLTLARIKSYRGEQAASRALRKLADDPRCSNIGRFTADRFVLMRSVLRPEGSEYHIVDEFGFVS